MDQRRKEAIAQASQQAMTFGSGAITTNAIGSGGAGGGWVTSSPVDVARDMYTYEHQINMRLNNGTRLSDKRFDYMAAYRYCEDKVAVFICVNGSYVVLEDGADLFPSDTLITQLRMLQK
jgi:hypothetical protein